MDHTLNGSTCHSLKLHVLYHKTFFFKISPKLYPRGKKDKI